MKANFKRILFFILIVIFIILVVVYFKINYHNNIIEVNKINTPKYQKIDNLMIIAHPDDETFWASNEIINNEYVVVCITCGTNKTRLKEIKKVLKYTDDKLISLKYPDKVLGIRSNWKFESEDIEKDLRKIIQSKKWKKILTHNKKGEYGHIQHKLTHKIVTKINPNNLSFFGKYYSKNSLDKIDNNELKQFKLAKNTLLKKQKLLTIYESQQNSVNIFFHMIPYEKIK